jgi:hypothetical protein
VNNKAASSLITGINTKSGRHIKNKVETHVCEGLCNYPLNYKRSIDILFDFDDSTLCHVK